MIREQPRSRWRHRDSQSFKSGQHVERWVVRWSNQGQLATREGQWKLVEKGKTFDGTPDGNKSLEGEDSLFLSDLSRDPGEKTNLRRQHPEVVDRLSTAAHKWLDEVKNK